MPKRLVACLAVMLCAVAVPRKADASGWDLIRWFDRLSGPKDFAGWGLELAFVCHGTPARDSNTAPDIHFDPGCFRMDRNQRRILFGASFARLEGVNTLPYATGTPVPDVHATPVMVTVDLGAENGFLGVQKWDFLDVGAGIGFVRFHDDRYGFTRFAIEFPRLTVKPLVFFSQEARKRRQLEALQIRASFIGIPGDIDAGDFGAIGSFHSSSEYIGPAVSVIFNGWALFQ